MKGLLAFMLERHGIARGEPWPWTQDPVLQRYKFTNVYRELDRTTRWMRENVTVGLSGGALVFNCAYFRYVGCPDPFERGDLPRVILDYDDDAKAAVRAGIRKGLDAGQKVFTAAYTIMKTGSRTPRELYVVDDVLAPLWEARSDVRGDTLEALFKSLSAHPGFGGTGFMAYEVSTDLRHCGFFPATPPDVLTWANTGPGCLRGLARVLGLSAGASARSTPGIMKKEALPIMRDVLRDLSAAWPHEPLEMRDLEHSLCEFDKYERVRLGEGVCRARYRRPAG